MKARTCPLCRRVYNEPPAISRRDQKMEICPECGLVEALEAARNTIAANLSQEEWNRITAEIIETARQAR